MRSLLNKWPQAAWLLFLFLTSCGTLSTTSLDDHDLESVRHVHHENLQQVVDTYARPMVEDGYTPGVIIGVLLPDRQEQFFGYGVSDKDTGTAPDNQTLFAVGSLSKGFLAAYGRSGG